MENQFNKLFWLCVGLISTGFLFLVALVWIPIPEANIRFADVTQGFVTGSMVTGAIGYLLGGNPNNAKKQTAIPGTTEIELKATQTTEQENANT